MNKENVMKKSVGTTDRLLRVVVAIAAVIGASILGYTSGWGIALLAIGVIMVVTSATEYCPIYSALGISTISQNREVRQNKAVAHH